MFDKEEKIIHFQFGIGTVESIETKTILGTRSRMARCVFPSHHDMELLVNIDRSYGLTRPLIKEEEVDGALHHLESYVPESIKTNWNKRRSDYAAKLKSGDIYQRCEVLKDLSIIAQSKSLSRVEQSMLEQSRDILASELAYVSGVEQQKVEERIARITSMN